MLFKGIGERRPMHPNARAPEPIKGMEINTNFVAKLPISIAQLLVTASPATMEAPSCSLGVYFAPKVIPVIRKKNVPIPSKKQAR